MKGKILRREVWLVIGIFIISRIVAMYFGLRMDYKALFQYWQYLDVETLRHHLLRGIWYDHAQPPFFNLLLGIIVKISGNAAPVIFEISFKLISLVNVFLLLHILKQLTVNNYIPILLSVLYLLSPATLIFECELFYTTFITMLLLSSVYFLIRFQQNQNWQNGLGIFIPLAILCLTRSMYHLVWLFVIAAIILFYYRKKEGFKILFVSSFLSLMLVAGWYFKNLMIFGNFSASTWIGMNVARNVFHDNVMTDSTHIEAFEPFSKISVYKPFISGDYEKRFAGLNDPDLLHEMKNDSFINENHIDYIEVSKKYMEASKQYMKTHPGVYLKNVLQSSIIFFTSATRYPLAEDQSKKIKYYDIIYSFNLSHFASGKQQRRIALTVSAIPKLLIYLAVFFLLLRSAIRDKKIDLYNAVIICTIAFVFTVSSLLEHYENMRFRFEIEPLFLILLGQVLGELLNKSHLTPDVSHLTSNVRRQT